MRNNKITAIDPTLLERYTVLDNLDLSGNDIFSVAGLMHVADTLRYLYVGRNNITHFDMQVDFNKLEILDVSFNFMTSFDVSSLCKADVGELDLIFNLLQQFPHIECLGMSLKRLFVAHNDITYLSDWDLKSQNALVFLDITANNIHTLDLCLMHDKCHHHYKSENTEKVMFWNMKKKLKITGERRQGEAA